MLSAEIESIMKFESPDCKGVSRPCPALQDLDRLASFTFMKTPFVVCLLAVTILCGSVSTGPAISKSSMGNLEVYVTAPQGVDVQPASIYVDGVFVGNVSQDLPVLYLKRGRHVVRVELAGMKTHEKRIDILGDPHHQFLDVSLEKQRFGRGVRVNS
jgi:hypothetical protein